MTNEELVSRIQAGENAEENTLQLWKQNRNLIAKEANRLKAYAEFDDLMQQGYLGLMEAVSEYDPEAGRKFSSYAVFWIDQSMYTYIHDYGKPIRFPPRIFWGIRKYKRIYADYYEQHGKEPNEAYMCQALGVSPVTLSTIIKAALMEDLRSLDEPKGDEEDGLFVADSVASGEDVEAEASESVFQEEMARDVWKCVDDELNERNSHVIRERYQNGATLSQIAKDLNVSTARCAVLHKDSLQRLQRKKILLDYWTYADGLYGCGVGVFRRTWTSSTERAAIHALEE